MKHPYRSWRAGYCGLVVLIVMFYSALAVGQLAANPSSVTFGQHTHRQQYQSVADSAQLGKLKHQDFPSHTDGNGIQPGHPVFALHSKRRSKHQFQNYIYLPDRRQFQWRALGKLGNATARQQEKSNLDIQHNGVFERHGATVR